MKGGAHLLASELIEYYSRLWRGLRLCHPGGLPGPLLGQYALKCPGNGQLSILGDPSDGIMNHTINTLQKLLKYSISIWRLFQVLWVHMSKVIPVPQYPGWPQILINPLYFCAVSPLLYTLRQHIQTQIFVIQYKQDIYRYCLTNFLRKLDQNQSVPRRKKMRCTPLTGKGWGDVWQMFYQLRVKLGRRGPRPNRRTREVKLESWKEQ